jgi:SAM-dependent methyltransferase
LSRAQILPPGPAAGRDEWDHHWASYGESAEGNPASAYRHRLVTKLIGNPTTGDTVLDIGSGQGELALLLKRAFPEATVVGIEYSAEGVHRSEAAAAAAGLRVNFVQRDLLGPAPVDGAVRGRAAYGVCSEVLEHVDDPGRLLRYASEYLAPGCRIVVTVPGGPRSAFDRHIGHRQHFRPAGLRRLLEGARFDVEYVARAGFPFFNLYRLAVIARGRRLIADLERGDASGGAKAQGAVLGFFDKAFRLNMESTPFGWQLVAVARFTGAGGAA